ncbi:hypothetical protein JCM10450v2_000494 [Rhodotorula kratochvilovae]
MPHHFAPRSIHPVCEDLLLAILEEMPSRNLLQTRSVSRTFQLLADEVLRRRFLDIAEDSSKQLVLESCAPYEQRALHCQPLAFSHFAPPTDGLFTGNVAHFSVDALAQDAAETRRLALDDGEMFQQNILSVHLRAATAPLSPRPRNPDAMDVDEASAPLPQSRFIDYNWTLDLATSLDRFFRSWFLESASEAISPRSSPSSSPSPSPSLSPSPSPSLSPSRSPSPSPSSRETRPRRLGPASPPARSALLSASIACVQVLLSDVLPDGDEADVLCLSPGPSPPGSRYGSPAAAGPPRVYEYTFEDVALDVAKVVVLTEENLPPCGGGGRAPHGGRGVRVLAL